MSGINKVIIVGNLGSDPEVKTLGSGQSLARFSIATSESWTGKDGQKNDRTEWHRIVAWGKLAEICGKHLSKGRQVYVEGKLQTSKYEDNQGQTKYSTEIVASNVQFLGGKGERSSSSRGDDGPTDFGPEPSFNSTEDIPF